MHSEKCSIRRPRRPFKVYDCEDQMFHVALHTKNISESFTCGGPFTIWAFSVVLKLSVLGEHRLWPTTCLLHTLMRRYRFLHVNHFRTISDVTERHNVFIQPCQCFHCVGSSKRKPSTGGRHVSIEQDLRGASCVKNFDNDFVAKHAKLRANTMLKTLLASPFTNGR